MDTSSEGSQQWLWESLSFSDSKCSNFQLDGWGENTHWISEGRLMVLLHLLTLGFCQGKLSIISRRGRRGQHTTRFPTFIEICLLVPWAIYYSHTIWLIQNKVPFIYSQIKGGSLNFMMRWDSWTQDHVNDDALLEWRKQKIRLACARRCKWPVYVISGRDSQSSTIQFMQFKAYSANLTLHSRLISWYGFLFFSKGV